MKVYTILIEDRHVDPKIIILDGNKFTKEQAIERAKSELKDYARSSDYINEMSDEDWIYHVIYSSEGDSITVEEHEI